MNPFARFYRFSRLFKSYLIAFDDSNTLAVAERPGAFSVKRLYSILAQRTDSIQTNFPAYSKNLALKFFHFFLTDK
jgi:hypothetical protein